MPPTGVRSRAGVTRRALLLGLVLIPLNTYWVVLAELRWYMILTINPLFVTPVFSLLVLVGLNSVLRRLRPAWAFSVAELLTVYVMLAVSCTVASLDYITNWTRMIGWGAWCATPENHWAEAILPHMPRWAVMSDPLALRGLFEGGNLYQADVLSAWSGPLAAWISFMVVSFATMLCLVAMVRKSWIEETRLSFPVVRLPLAMVGLENTGFYRSALMWSAAGLVFANGTLTGLAQLHPGLPHLSTAARFPAISEPPWSAIGWTPMSTYPFAIGLAYFVPLDVLFSCWFFYVFMKLQLVLGQYVGAQRLPGYPFPAEQSIGAWFTYGGILLFLTRTHWARVVGALRGRPREDDAREALPLRTAFAGLVAGLVVLVSFWHATGMSVPTALLSVVAYYLLGLCLARVRAEAGTPHDVVSLEPMKLLTLVSSRVLGRGDVIGAGLSHWLWRFNRSHAMPTQLESLRLWQGTGASPRQLVGPILAATVLACVAAPWASLHIAYREGAMAKCIGFKPLTGQEMYTWMAATLTQGHGVEWPRWIAVGGAAGLVLLLWVMQTRSAWLWLHPLGYCIGPSLNWVWFPFFLAWVVKGLIVRYGDQRLYRRLIPLFLGLVLGDYVAGAVWAILSPALGVPGYHVFH